MVPPMVPRSGGTPPSNSDVQQYLSQYGMDRIIRDLLAMLIRHKPVRPLVMLLLCLRTAQTRMDQGHSVNTKELFQWVAEQYMQQEVSGRFVPVYGPLDWLKEETKTMNPSVPPFFVYDPRDIEKGMEVEEWSEEEESLSQTLSLGNDSESEYIEQTVQAFASACIRSRRNSVSAEPLDPTLEESKERVIIPKTRDAQMRIAAAISGNLLFRNLEPDQRREVVEAMFERRVFANEKVIVQGDEGDNFYVVDEGYFQVFVNEKKMIDIGPGGSFGELALMYNTERAATVMAITDGTLWAVDRVTFRRIIMNNAFRKRKMYESFLKTVPILETLSPTELVKVADALEPVLFEDGETILEQGDVGDCFFIVVEGEALVTILPTGSDQSEVVGRLQKGNYFGEVALITDRPRTATVISLGECKCVCLDTKAFIRLLGPCMEILQRNMECYKKYEPFVHQ